MLKWPGSKRLVAAELTRWFPSFQGRFYDPFVGSGAVLPYMQGHVLIAGDIHPSLIGLWQMVQSAPDAVADGYEQRWHELQERGQQVFYDIRAKYNAVHDPVDFLFLTRTCVNGLVRFDRQGNFNNSFHLTRPGIHPERLRQHLFQWSRMVAKVQFRLADYRETLADVQKDSLVFFDPPYLGGKKMYLRDSFQFPDFLAELDRLNRLGVRWVLTFDGRAGERVYEHSIPHDLYRVTRPIRTGYSTFRRVMNKHLDVVEESVYLNFLPENGFKSEEE